MGKVFKIPLLLLVLLAIPVGIYLVVRAGPTRLGSRAGGFEEVMVFIMPAQAKLRRGETVNFAVKIDTGKETVSGGEILVNFDPLFLSLDGEIKEGAVFEDLTSQVKRGQVAFDCQGEVLGQGTVVVLPLKALGRGEVAVEIDESSVIWGEGGATNVLGKRAGVKVVIE